MKRPSLINTVLIAALTATAVGLPARADEKTEKDSKVSRTTTTETTTKTTHKRAKRGDAADTTTATAGDNTAVNKRDRSDREVTADQQSNERGDLRLAANIRQSLVKDDTLSTSAHNVKIIVQKGAVTLKGPVKTTAEKTEVEKKATELAGHGKVTSELDVVP